MGETGFRVGYPGNKAVSHVLRQLLVLLQLFEEDAARERKAESDISVRLPSPLRGLCSGQHKLVDAPLLTLGLSTQ